MLLFPRNSWRQAYFFPGFFVDSFINDAIVQAAWPSLPKLDQLRLQNVTSPIRWFCHFLVGILCLKLRPLLFEYVTIWYFLALRRNNGAYLAAFRTRMEILFRGLFIKLFDT